MKKLLLVVTLMFMSLNFIACSQKKDSKTRLTRGSGRESEINATNTRYDWTTLNQQSDETALNSNDPNAAARAFWNDESKFRGPVTLNTVAMRLRFYNGRVDPNSTMIGLRFYDDFYDPLAYFLGGSSNRRVREGFRNGNHVRVVFADVNDNNESLGDVIVEGDIINGYTFNGQISYSGGVLGQFSVNASYAIF